MIRYLAIFAVLMSSNVWAAATCPVSNHPGLKVVFSVSGKYVRIKHGRELVVEDNGEFKLDNSVTDSKHYDFSGAKGSSGSLDVFARNEEGGLNFGRRYEFSFTFGNETYKGMCNAL